ncbi:MAG TPA: tetratricopeptide repeat protein [Acidobacteriota bacterium]|nr:tetratricopeptide repeat protein [Acidobacteriota bacterium]
MRAPLAAILLLGAAMALPHFRIQPADVQDALRLVREKQFSQAEEIFLRLQEEGRLEKQHLEEAAEASRQLSHWERVIGFYQAFPLDIPQRVKLYEAYLRAGRQEEARRQLLDLRRDRPSDERFVHLLAFLHLNRGQAQEASAIYREFLQENPQAFQSHINRALVLFSLQRTDEALKHLEVAFAHGGQEANLYFYRQLAGNMQGMEEPQLAQLAEDVRQASGLPPLGARGHLLLAREFSRLNRYPPAIEGYRRYLQEHPQDNEVRLDLARLHFLQGDSGQALQILQPLIRQEGTEGNKARLFAAELAVKEEDYQAAAAHLQSLPSEFRERGLYLYLSARVAMNRGEIDQARDLLESVTRRHPEITEAFLHLGRLYMRQGRREEGRRLLQEFQRRKP